MFDWITQTSQSHDPLTETSLTRVLKANRYFLAGALIVGAAVALYLPILRADFVYDSRAQIVVDEYIHDAGNFAEVVSLNILSREKLDSTRPMHLLSLMLDAAVWDRHPAGYHFTDIILHASVIALLMLFAAREVGSRPVAFAATATGAAWFGFHPLNTETVCAVSYREDLLVGLFTILSLVILQRSSRRPATPASFAGFLTASILSVMSKESGIVTPFIGLAYLLLRRSDNESNPDNMVAPRRIQPSWLIAAILSTALALVFIAARFALAPEQHAIFLNRPVYPGGSFGRALEIIPRLWTLALQLMIWPYGNLSADYTNLSIAHIPLAGAIMILIVIIGVTAWTAIRAPQLRLALALVVLPLLPVSNLIPLHIAIADHFFYASTMGLALGFTQIIIGIDASGRKWAARIVLALLVIATIGNAVYASQRRDTWSERTALWSDTLETTPNSFPAANNLGFALYDIGRYAEAVNAWHHVFHIDDKQADAWAGMAIGLDALGLDTPANTAWRRAIALDKRYKDSTALSKHLYWEAHYIERMEIVRNRVEKEDASQTPHIADPPPHRDLHIGGHVH